MGEELWPPVEYVSEYDMRFGPRHYTDEQAAFMAEVVANRKPLPDVALPLEEPTEEQA